MHSVPPDSAANGDPPLDLDVEGLIAERLTGITEQRAVIEQAKGMLMLIHDIDADQAFELLKWRSQDTNTKLRPLAEQLVAEFRQLSGNALLPSKEVFERRLMTIHQRVDKSKDLATEG
ncbi:hypothetical protein BKG82_28720 [Mycobacteroides chelonae]|uniref:ANTAR domain-containing protein n=1 Tax=Mycobacteroides chelonae TaxID=1774 RepID=A0A1S1LI38_MYCCH|nr:hypothetical protein BKG82_28720 [Mycobacteroides chelonae]